MYMGYYHCFCDMEENRQLLRSWFSPTQILELDLCAGISNHVEIGEGMRKPFPCLR